MTDYPDVRPTESEVSIEPEELTEDRPAAEESADDGAQDAAPSSADAAPDVALESPGSAPHPADAGIADETPVAEAEGAEPASDDRPAAEKSADDEAQDAAPSSADAAPDVALEGPSSAPQPAEAGTADETLVAEAEGAEPAGDDRPAAEKSADDGAQDAAPASADAAPDVALEGPSSAPQPADAGTADETPVAEAEGAEPASEGAKEPAAAAPQAKAKREERPEVKALRSAMDEGRAVEGKVIGWNKGGLHVVVDGVTAFCPRSEIELGAAKDPATYVDQTMPFQVIKVQKRGRRVVVSRRALEERVQQRQVSELRDAMKRGEVLEGKVSSLTDFGAFVDLGGLDGLVHISEMTRSRIAHPSERLAVGDTVQVKILKIADAGKRISLSMKALEADPWEDLEKQFPAGEIVPGTVERTADFGAFVEIAPGVTGLLPTSAMNLPRNASPARIYHPGREISVQILSIDRRRRRISLALEGSQMEGTRADLKSYLEHQKKSVDGFGALAAAFDRVRDDDD